MFTETVPNMKRLGIHLETITEDDDFLSEHGKQKRRRVPVSAPGEFGPRGASGKKGGPARTLVVGWVPNVSGFVPQWANKLRLVGPERLV